MVGNSKSGSLKSAMCFIGLSVKTGKGEDGEITTLDVPITYASRDRVVGWLLNRHNQNSSFTLPAMSFYMTSLQYDPDRHKGKYAIDRQVFLKPHGVFPDDLEVMHRVMPTPYSMMVDVYVYASNTDQMYQILEQLLMIFIPDIQIQRNDDMDDWAKITKMEMVGMSNEESVPTGTEKRIILWTLQFQVPIWLTPPTVIRDNVIQTIKMRISSDMNDIGGLDDLPDDDESIMKVYTLSSMKVKRNTNSGGAVGGTTNHPPNPTTPDAPAGIDLPPLPTKLDGITHGGTMGGKEQEKAGPYYTDDFVGGDH